MAGVAVAVLLAAGLWATPRGVRPWDDMTRAPALAVARVEGVAVGPGTGARRTCTARLMVLRGFGATGDTVRLAYPCVLAGSVIMGGPDYPHIEKGRVYLFPLAGAKLFREDERLYPVIAAAPEGPPPGSAREFVLRELANVLLRGSYAEMVAVGALPVAVADELMPHLAAALRAGEARWLDIATSQLANMGIPRQALPEQGGPLAARALMRVKAERRADGLVRQMLRYSDIHGWGSAATLIPEYKDHPLLLRLLPGCLEKGQAGALNIAWWAARNGQPAVLGAALPAALRALRENQANSSDRNAAAALVVDYGSEEQFAAFLALFHAADPQRRYLMWQAPYADKGARALRLIALLLEDERTFSGNMRFCDLAGGRLQGLTGERFGFTYWNQDIAGRNAAVARARRWMATSPGRR